MVQNKKIIPSQNSQYFIQRCLSNLTVNNPLQKPTKFYGFSSGIFAFCLGNVLTHPIKKLVWTNDQMFLYSVPVTISEWDLIWKHINVLYLDDRKSTQCFEKKTHCHYPQTPESRTNMKRSHSWKLFKWQRRCFFTHTFVPNISNKNYFLDPN